MKKIFGFINRNKAYIFPIVILIGLLVLLATGLTYAYFDIVVDSNEEGSSFRVGATNLNVSLSNPVVDLNDLYPIYDDYKDTQANLFTFSLSNTSKKLAGCVDLYLSFNSIDDAFMISDIKWELVNNTNHTTTSGNFSQIEDGRLLLKENETITRDEVLSYTLKIWLSFSTVKNQSGINASMNAKLTSIAYAGGCAFTNETTYTSGTNQFLSGAGGYYKIETYNANGTYTSGEIYLAAGESIYATVGASSDIKCYLDSATGLCSTSSGQNANNSRILYTGDSFLTSYMSGLAGSNSPVYTNSSNTLSNNTLHPTGKFFINGSMKFNTVNLEDKIVITYMGKYAERTNTKLNNVRYIKDCTNGNTLDSSNAWVEIQAIKNGSNIAYKKSLSGGTTSQVIVDGVITSSQNVSVNGSNVCVTVDLGRTYDLDEIAVWHPYASGLTYNNNVTSVSSNNSTWTEVINKQEPETSYGKRASAYPKNRKPASSSTVTDASFFQYEMVNSNGIKYDIDFPTCRRYMVDSLECGDDSECLQDVVDYCNSYIKLNIFNKNIDEENYANYGISNVEFYDRTIKITNYIGSGASYDIDIDTCKDYVIDEGLVSGSGQMLDLKANIYCNVTVNEQVYDGTIAPSDYSDYGISNVSISNITDVVIPSEINGIPVTVIGESAFNNKHLTSVVIPSGVFVIDRYAFQSNQLTSIDLPNTVFELGDYAFYENELEEVTIRWKSSISDFDSYGYDVWGWASGYDDNDIYWDN